MQYAVFDDGAIARRHAFVIERRAAQPLRQVRPFDDLNKRREQLLAQTIEQERGFAIQITATDGGHETTDQPRGNGCFENHRGLHGFEFARIQAAQGALAANAPHFFRALQGVCRARRGIPIVALHTGVRLRNHGARDSVTRGGITREKTQAIAVHEQRFLRRNRAAFGVIDARINRERRRFARLRKFDRLFHRQIPRMIEVEI